jgi:hypothetical protein
MLNQKYIGHKFKPFTVTVEKGRLCFFAKAIGETNNIYTCEAAARDAGYKTIPAPPTFPMVLDLECEEKLPVLGVLNMDIGKVLHGGQEFEYFLPIHAGDEITVTEIIKDIFDKKGGALEFVVLEKTYTNQNGEQVAKATQSLVYRNA